VICIFFTIAACNQTKSKNEMALTKFAEDAYKLLKEEITKKKEK
jgi:hypothetical protein